MANRMVSFSVPAPLFGCLDDVAARMGRSRSGLIKEILEQFLPLIDTQAHGRIQLVGSERKAGGGRNV